MSAHPHLRRPAVALAALTGLALLAPAAWSAPQPTPGQASFKVKQAFCGYEPATDKIKAKGAITATVKQLPADEFFYLKARLTIDGKKPGGDWKPVGVHRTSSIGFGPDELPFALDADGISTEQRGMKVAWMRDPDGSVLTVFSLD